MFSPDGERVLTCGDNTVAVWDTVSGDQIAAFDQRNSDGGRDLGAQFSQDGDYVLTASRMIDVHRSRALTGPPSIVLPASISRGRGHKLPSETEDMLLRDSPDDLFQGLLALVSPDEQRGYTPGRSCSTRLILLLRIKLPV